MLINNFYYIVITSSNSNPLIDKNVSVKVEVYDFNDKALANMPVTISVDKGHFISYTRNNTKTNITGVSTKLYNGITGSNGSFTMGYNCVDWGLCTFKCDVEKCQIYVRGFKKVNVRSKNESFFYVDESSRACRLKWKHIQTNLDNNSKQLDTIVLPKQEYYPNEIISTTTYRSDIVHSFTKDGVITARTSASEFGTRSMGDHYEMFEWHY